MTSAFPPPASATASTSASAIAGPSSTPISIPKSNPNPNPNPNPFIREPITDNGNNRSTRLPSLPPPQLSTSAGGSGRSSPTGPPYGSNEWRYEMRREAQLIIPGLYLGPLQASSNLMRLKEQGITHVLCVRDSKEARFIYPRFPTEFQYMTLDISDTADQNLITLFPSSRDFIEEALNMGGKVLVHCNGGIALSPAIVVGYLMWKFNWTSEQALMYIQTKRYCASPRSFSNQLKEYEPVYMAQKMMQVDSRTGPGNHKRQASEDDDEEGDVPSVKRLPPGSDPTTDITMD